MWSKDHVIILDAGRVPMNSQTNIIFLDCKKCLCGKINFLLINMMFNVINTIVVKKK